MTEEDGDGWIPPDGTLSGGCLGCALMIASSFTVVAMLVLIWEWLA